MNYKYFIIDEVGYTYEIKSFEGMDNVKPQDVEEMATLMADEKGLDIDVVEVIKKMYINNVMICQEHYEKGVNY